jgi:hypothetical protein
VDDGSVESAIRRALRKTDGLEITSPYGTHT